jgi:hypothetical protein
VAAEYNSAASPFQAAAAASIGPDPGPTYIRPELISGVNIAKSIATQLLWPRHRQRPRSPHRKRHWRVVPSRDGLPRNARRKSLYRLDGVDGQDVIHRIVTSATDRDVSG